jgi:outer membrane protein TolC
VVGGLSLRMPLVVAPAWANLGAALAGVEASQAGADVARASLRAGLAQAAWLGEAAQAFVEATERAVDNAARHYEAAERGVAAGVLPPLATLQARAELAARRSDLVQAQTARSRAQLATGALLGRDGPVRVKVPLASVDLPDARPDLSREAVAEAIDGRPETAALLAQARAYKAQEAAAWLMHAPTLSASFGASVSDVAYPTGETSAWRFTVDLQWVAFDGGLRYGRLAEARAQRALAASALRETAVAASREIHESERALDVAEEALRLARVRREASVAAADVAERAFQRGPWARWRPSTPPSARTCPRSGRSTPGPASPSPGSRGEGLSGCRRASDAPGLR